MWDSNAFMKSLESYYGNYRSGVKKVVREYLETIPAEDLPLIRRELIMTVSTQFGHVPDVATIEKARNEMKPPDGQISSHRPVLPDPLVGTLEIEEGGLWKRVMAEGKKIAAERKKVMERMRG